MADSKIILSATPMELQGVVVLAHHAAWGLNPRYSLKDIYAATPGATYDLKAHRDLIGGAVGSTDAYWKGDLHDTSTAWIILAHRLRELNRLTTFPFAPTLAGVESNRKAVSTALKDQRGASSWASLKGFCMATFDYDGPVGSPLWESDGALLR